MATYKLRIDRWQPASKNKLMKGHLRTRMRLEKVDRNMVAGYCILNRIPIARGPRRVSLTIILAPKQRGCDPDAYWMSTLDSLVSAHMLIDDNRHYVSLGPVKYEDGAERATLIELEDL